MVVLHGAEAGERSYFLYQQLADLLAQHGVAVLRYDRREAPDGHDVPLATQAADALAATSRLQDVVSGPVGLWGYSQGAWAATLAAATDPGSIDFLICVSHCGVSPAEQMRVGCANQLRKHGFSEGDVEDLVTTRTAVESYLRTGRNRTSVQATLTWASAQPWFAHAYLPPVLPDTPGTWHDMDYDPQPALDRLVCPVLAFYGESDEWMPIAESLAAGEAARSRGCLCDLTVVRLPGADHLPTLGGAPEPDAITREYCPDPDPLDHRDGRAPKRLSFRRSSGPTPSRGCRPWRPDRAEIQAVDRRRIDPYASRPVMPRTALLRGRAGSETRIALGP